MAYIIRKPFISNATHDVQEESSRRAITDIYNAVIDPTLLECLEVENDNENFIQQQLLLMIFR